MSKVSEHIRVAIYARQSAEVDQGIQQQLDSCRAEARHRGWRVVREFADNDTSATKARGPRTDWAQMLKSFDAGEFDAVLVNDADRLTRRLVDVLEIMGEERRMRVLTVRGGIDTAQDDFMFKQFVLFAEREVALRRSRNQDYKVTRLRLGHPTPGAPAFGYRWVPAISRDDRGTRYSIDEEEAATVRRMYAEFLAGASLGQIARDLNADGRRTRNDAKWYATTVRDVLMNPTYAALLAPSQPTGEYDLAKIQIEECIEGAWEPIVDKEQVLASRARLVGRAPNHRGTARKWLLSGLAVCSTCKAPVRSARGETHPTSRVDGTGKAESRRYHAYRCVNGHFMRNGDVLDEFIAEICINRLAEPDIADLLAPQPDAVDVGALTTRRRALAEREQDLAQLVAKGKMRAAAAEEALDQLAAELREIDDTIAAAVSSDPLAELASIEDVRQWWEGQTLARHRAVVETLFETLEICPVGKGKRVTTTDEAAATMLYKLRGKQQEPSA